MKQAQFKLFLTINDGTSSGRLYNPILYPLLVLPVNKDVEVDSINVSIMVDGNLLSEKSSRPVIDVWTVELIANTFNKPVKIPVGEVQNASTLYTGETSSDLELFPTCYEPTINLRCKGLFARAFQFGKFWWTSKTSTTTNNLPCTIYITVYYNE